MDNKFKIKKDSLDKKAKEWLTDIRENGDELYDPLINFYFINKSLDMSPGKVAVQTARAGQVMLYNELKLNNSSAEESLKQLFELDFMRGNKSITLKCNQNQMIRILDGDINKSIQEVDDNINLYPVYDIGATEVDTNSLTVIAMSTIKESKVKHITKKFQLY